MNLRKLYINNFRSCKDVTIDIGSMQSLVGSNNSGKSTILRALDFLFNPSVSKVDQETFWNGDTSQKIWIEAVFDHLSADEIQSLQGYLRPDGTFQIARSVTTIAPSDESEESDESQSPGEVKTVISQHFCVPMPIYDWLRASSITGANIDEWWAEKNLLVANDKSFVDLLGNSKPSVTSWKAKAKEFADQYLTPPDYEDSWGDNPRGYSNVLKGTLPHFILVPAVRDVSDEAKVTKSNPMGRLLYAVLEGVTGAQNEAIDQLLQQMQKMLNKVGGEDRLPAIVETESKLNAVLQEYMDCSLEIEFQMPTLETIMTSPKIYADDGFRNIAENKGHGLQRAIIFSILRCYSELVTGVGEAKKRTLIFAVEEPELYMHPQAQRTIRRVFKSISEGGDQVLYSTHSALMLDVADFDQIIRVEAIHQVLDGISTIQSRIWQIKMGDMIKDVEARHPGVTATDESIRALYLNAYHPMRAEGFFAKSIILVEGPTEQYSIPIYAEAIGYFLDNLNISIVDSGEKGNLDRLYRIFNELGIPCFLLFDYDKQSTDGVILAKSRELLEMFGQNPEPPEGLLISERIACFPNKWETDLANEIPDLPALTAAARAELGLSDNTGKPLVARYVAKTLTSRIPLEIPPSLRQILDMAIRVPWESSCLTR